MARTALLSLLLLSIYAPVSAQSRPPRLASVFNDLFGPNGLVVNSEEVLPDGSTHSAHFNSTFQSNFSQFNIALASQLTSLPLPSPASGFTYRFDDATGTFIRSTRSFGPILTDRAETIGRGKFAFGYNFQFYTFDRLEGIDLSSVPAVFTHDNRELGGGRTDVVTQIRTITGDGVRFSVDTSAQPVVLREAIEALMPAGTCVLLGSARAGTEASFEMPFLQFGRVVRGIIQGESHPPQFIPRLVDLLMEGKMPVDRMMTFYPLRDINQAGHDSSTGATIKPVLRMPR